ncbi:hypothetical protein [Halorussus sp. AFM4]
MTDAQTTSEVEQGAIQHLEAALEADEMDEINFHVRQALQLLGVE